MTTEETETSQSTMHTAQDTALDTGENTESTAQNTSTAHTDGIPTEEELSELDKDALIAYARMKAEEAVHHRRKNDAALRKSAKLGLNFETPNNQKALGKVKWDEDIAAVVRENIPYLVQRDDKTVITDDSEDAVTHSLIKGDNFPALLTLHPRYRRSIDVIYVDPPYNTGNKDFIYNDRYVDKENSYRHSHWLRFMARRLLLAQELLSDAGMIFVSINNHEQAHLKLLMDDVFGAENFVSTMIWHNKKSGGNNARFIVTENEYVLVYARNIRGLAPFSLEHSGEYLKKYELEDEHGRYFWHSFSHTRTNNQYPIVCPDGTVLEYDHRGNRISWLRNEERFKQDLEAGAVRIVQSGGRWVVQFKQYLSSALKPRSIISDKGGTSQGNREAISILGRDAFSYPKPSSLVKHLISFHPDKSATVLDFFAGSGTTGQAVAELNMEDGGNRTCILVTDAGKTGGSENGDMSGGRGAVKNTVNTAGSNAGNSSGHSTVSKTESSVDIADDVTWERLRRVFTGEDWAASDKAYAAGGNLEMYEVSFLPTVVPSVYAVGLWVQLASLEILMKLEDTFMDLGYNEEDAEEYAQKLYHRWRRFAEDEKGDLARWD